MIKKRVKEQPPLKITSGTKSGRVYVGDIVKTNDKFLPKKKDGQLSSDVANNYRGFVVSRRGDYYGIRFGDGLDFTDKLDGLLSKPVGALLKREDFDVEDDL